MPKGVVTHFFTPRNCTEYHKGKQLLNTGILQFLDHYALENLGPKDKQLYVEKEEESSYNKKLLSSSFGNSHKWIKTDTQLSQYSSTEKKPLQKHEPISESES